jgi:hypothetical protein
LRKRGFFFLPSRISRRETSIGVPNLEVKIKSVYRSQKSVSMSKKPLAPTSLFNKIKGVKYFEVSAGHGDSAALREITRRWSFHGTRRGRRPSAFLCGIPFGFNYESVDPGRCFRKAHHHPRAQSKLSPQKQVLKVKGGKLKNRPPSVSPRIVLSKF